MTLKGYIIATKVLFFGWLLFFPFHGPGFSMIAADRSLDGSSLVHFFILAHASTYLLAGVFLKREKRWKDLMLWNLLLIITTVTVLGFSSAESVWLVGMAVLGAASSLFVLGWSYPYSSGIPAAGRMKLMAWTIIGANIIYIIFHLLTEILPAALLFPLALLPLLTALWPVIHFPREIEQDISEPRRRQHPFPSAFMLIFSLFIFGLYLNSGIMYRLVLPTFTVLEFSPPLYRYIPYVLVLLLMVRFGEKLRRYFPIYMGVSMLGLAFVSFIMLGSSPAGSFFLTQALFEAAFAFLDLFAWTLLGDIAYIYGTPFRIFGYALAAMTGSIFLGGVFSERLQVMQDNYYLVAAMFAVASIFLTALVIPWLNERINQDFFAQVARETPQRSALDRVLSRMPEGKVFTPRELEIAALLLKGLTNREIARQLFISENTLKSHLKNIYQKVGVTQKRELLSMALEDNEKPDPPPF